MTPQQFIQKWQHNTLIERAGAQAKNYKLRRFSSERLMHFITQMDRDVEIVIRPKGRKRAPGLLSVSFA